MDLVERAGVIASLSSRNCHAHPFTPLNCTAQSPGSSICDSHTSNPPSPPSHTHSPYPPTHSTIQSSQICHSRQRRQLHTPPTIPNPHTATPKSRSRIRVTRAHLLHPQLPSTPFSRRPSSRRAPSPTSRHSCPMNAMMTLHLLAPLPPQRPPPLPLLSSLSQRNPRCTAPSASAQRRKPAPGAGGPRWRARRRR